MLKSTDLNTGNTQQIPQAELTSNRFRSNTKLQGQFDTINKFKGILAMSTQSNTVPTPMLVRVVNLYNISENAVLDVQAVFDSWTDPILVQSFLSTLQANAQSIFGNQANVTIST